MNFSALAWSVSFALVTLASAVQGQQTGACAHSGQREL
jgi:hypothetical protein